MANIRNWEEISIGFARQSAYPTENTADGSFIYMEAEMAAPPDRERKVHDIKYAHSQIGGNVARKPGSKHGGKFSVKFPLRTLLKTYDGGAGQGGAHVLGTTDGIIAPEFLLLGNALGSAGVTAVAADSDFTKGKHLSVDVGIPNDVTAGSTAGTVEVADATLYKEGQLLIAQTGSALPDANPTIMWIEDATAGTTITLSEDVEAAAVPANLDETYDTMVAYLSKNARVPLTMRLFGDQAGFKFAAIGCKCVELRVNLGMGELWWVEMDYMYTDRNEYTANGGLQQPGKYYTAPALLGDDGGRMLYGTQGAATEALANGWRDMQLKVAWGGYDFHDINAAEGISDHITLSPTIGFSAKYPVLDDDTATGGEDQHEQLLTDETRKAFFFASGEVFGEFCSLYLPAMQLTGVPKRELVDGVEHHSMEWETGEFDADTGTDAPANSLIRFGAG